MTSHFRPKPENTRLDSVLISLFCLIAYGHTLFFNFLMQDDYITAQDFSFSWPFLCLGRPICAIHQELFSLMGPSHLSQAIMRLLSIILLAATAVLLNKWLHKLNYPKTLRLGMSLGIVTLPSSLLYIHWISAGHYLVGFIFSQLAAFALLAGLDTRYKARAALAGVLQLAALCTNQAAAMYIWPLLAMAIYRMDRYSKPVPKIIRLFFPPLVAMGIYLAGFKFMNSFVMPHTRTNLSFDIQSKLDWFFTYPVPNALGLWNAYPYLALITAILVIIIAGLAIKFISIAVDPAKENLNIPSILIALTAILFLSYAPSLATPENWPGYRTLFPLQVLLVFLFLNSINSILLLFRAPGFAFKAVTGAIIGLSLIIVFKNSLIEVILPHKMELEFVTQGIREVASLSDNSGKIVLKMPTSGRRIAPMIRYDEFGHASTSQIWFAPYVVRLAMAKTASLEGKKREIIVVDQDYSVKNQLNVIDMNKFRGTRQWNIYSPLVLPKE